MAENAPVPSQELAAQVNNLPTEQAKVAGQHGQEIDKAVRKNKLVPDTIPTTLSVEQKYKLQDEIDRYHEGSTPEAIIARTAKEAAKRDYELGENIKRQEQAVESAQGEIDVYLGYLQDAQDISKRLTSRKTTKMTSDDRAKLNGVYADLAQAQSNFGENQQIFADALEALEAATQEQAALRGPGELVDYNFRDEVNLADQASIERGKALWKGTEILNVLCGKDPTTVNWDDAEEVKALFDGRDIDYGTRQVIYKLGQEMKHMQGNEYDALFKLAGYLEQRGNPDITEDVIQQLEEHQNESLDMSEDEYKAFATVSKEPATPDEIRQSVTQVTAEYPQLTDDNAIKMFYENLGVNPDTMELTGNENSLLAQYRYIQTLQGQATEALVREMKTAVADRMKAGRVIRPALVLSFCAQTTKQLQESMDRAYRAANAAQIKTAEDAQKVAQGKMTQLEAQKRAVARKRQHAQFWATALNGNTIGFLATAMRSNFADAVAAKLTRKSAKLRTKADKFREKMQADRAAAGQPRTPQEAAQDTQRAQAIEDAKAAFKAARLRYEQAMGQGSQGQTGQENNDTQEVA